MEDSRLHPGLRDEPGSRSVDQILDRIRPQSVRVDIWLRGRDGVAVILARDPRATLPVVAHNNILPVALANDYRRTCVWIRECSIGPHVLREQADAKLSAKIG